MPPKRLEIEFPDLRNRLASWLRDAFADPTVEISVQAFASTLGRRKQTIYNHDKRLGNRANIARVIAIAKQRRERLHAPIEERLRRRRVARTAEQRIQTLVNEVALWRDRYHNVNELLVVLQAAAVEANLDVARLYLTGLQPPNREVSKARQKGRIPAYRRP
jgi:hypothetical protein